MHYCDDCGVRRRGYQQDYRGYEPWREGGRGTPPVYGEV